MLHLLITLESFWCSLSHLSYTHVVLCLCSTVLIICRVFLYSLFFFCYGYTWSSCYCPLSWFHPWVLMITVLSYLGMLRWIGPFYCLDHTYIYIYMYFVHCSHHAHDVSYVLVPLSIATTLERFCMCLHMDTELHAYTVTSLTPLYPYVKVNIYPCIMCLLSVNAYTHYMYECIHCPISPKWWLLACAAHDHISYFFTSMYGDESMSSPILTRAK